MTDLQVLEHDGTPLAHEGGLWLLEEARRYQLITPASEAWLGARALKAIAHGVFELPTDHVVGHTHIVWTDRHRERHTCPVRITPRADKLSPDLWLAMVAELEAFFEGVTVGAAGARHGSVGLTGASLPLLAEALLPLVPDLLDAFAALISELRTLERTRLSPRPLPSARRVDGETLRWLTRHPEAAAWTQPWHDAVGEPPWVPLREAQDTLDHPANRYVAWLIDRVGRTLEQAAKTLARQARHPHAGETAPWCEARARRLGEAAGALTRALLASPLARLPRRPASEAALLVVTDDPRYARVHRLGRRFLTSRFRNNGGDDLPPPVEPSFTIYELWTFLAVGRRLEGALPSWSWTWSQLDRLIETRTGSGARLEGRGPSGQRLCLVFNQRFVSSLKRSTQSAWSLSKERRPDLCVTYEDDTTRRWLVLDAKYRTGASKLAEAFTSAHVYRDALRWDGLGGAPQAGLLLTPSHSADAAAWFEEAFLEAHGCGIRVLRPGLAASGHLARWILGTLAPHLEVPRR